MFKKVFTFLKELIFGKQTDQIYVPGTVLMEYFVGVDWKYIPNKEIPKRINDTVGYEMVYLYDTFNESYKKMNQYYIDNILCKGLE